MTIDEQIDDIVKCIINPNCYWSEEKQVFFQKYEDIIIEELLKRVIEDGQRYDLFKKVVEDDQMLIKKSYWNKENRLKKQLNKWLEEKYTDINENRNDIKFLISCGASKKEALKISIEKPRFESFKNLINDTLLTEIKNSEWNRENNLQKQLDKWLEIKCKDKDIENIKFLLKYEADKKVIYNEIKRLIKTTLFYEFKHFVKELKKTEIIIYEEIKKCVVQESELQNKLNNWLEEKYNKKNCDKNDVEDIEFLLNCGAEIKTMHNKIKGLIKTSTFEEFKSFVKELKKAGIITYEEIKKLVTKEVELQNKLNVWLEEKCKEKDIEYIEFLLSCGAKIKTIRNNMKGLIKTSIFEEFKSFVIKLTTMKITTYIEIKNIVIQEKELQNQLNIWLEEKYIDVNKNGNDIKFLIISGASKKEALILSIEKPRFESFKNLIKEEEVLLKKIKNSEWNKENSLQKQLDKWLEEKYNKKNCDENDIENIKFLLKCEADIKVIYNEIKGLIKTSTFEEFKSFVKELKKTGIITYEEIKKLVTKEVELQNKLNNWLEEKCDKKNCDEKDIEDIEFLLNCGAEIKTIHNKIKGLIKTSTFEKFKSFVKELKKTEIITYEEIKKCVVQETELQNKLNFWLEDKRNKNDMGNIKFLFDCGATIDNIYIHNQMKKAIGGNNINKIDFILKFFKEYLFLSIEEQVQIEKIKEEERLKQERNESRVYNTSFNPWEDTNPH